MKRILNVTAVAAALTWALALPAQAAVVVSSTPSLVNGDFEQGPAGISGYSIFDASGLPGWHTTASDNMVEVWTSGFLGVQAYSGNRFAELNANMSSALYQTATGIAAGSAIGYEFAHRGRAGDESIRVLITDLGADQIYGTADDTTLLSQVFTDGIAAWGYHSGGSLIAVGNTVRFSFDSLNAGSVGNFIDAVAFGVNVGRATPASTLATPEPTSILLAGLALVTAWGALGLRREAKVKPAA